MKGLNLLLGVAIGSGLFLSGCAKSGGSGDKGGAPVRLAQCTKPFAPTSEVQALGTAIFSGLWAGTGVLEDGVNSEKCGSVNFEIYQDNTKIRINTAQLVCETRCLEWGKSEFQVRNGDIFLQEKKVGQFVSSSSAYIEFTAGRNTKYTLMIQRNGQQLLIRDLREYWVNFKTSFFGTTSTLRKVQ